MDFEQLSNQHKDAVYRQMVRLCGNREDAEDVLMESLLKAYRGLAGLSAPEAFRSWLGRIANRVCWQLRQKEAMLPLLQLSAMEEDGQQAVDAAPSAEEKASAAEMKQIFKTALDSLPADYRAVYELRAIEELSGDETARRLGLSIPAMKSRWLRAKKLFRERLDQSFAPPAAPERQKTV